jgi:hypothetical protein
MVRITALIAATLVSSAVGIKDGNPYNWDRVRRCDDDYGTEVDPLNEYDTVPCGLCEGIGGEVWGDELSDFIPTTCTPVATAQEVEPMGAADWPGLFTCDLEEIMINECDDSGMCNFPGPTSVREHEYVRQSGVWNMDFEVNKRLLFEYDYVVDATEPPPGGGMVGEVGDGATDIYHYNGRPIADLAKDMFIIVKDAIPFIGDLCICVSPGTGPVTNDHMRPNPSDITSINSTYPVQFLGREMLGVEYQGANNEAVEMLVEHWIKGPHHIWVSVETQQIVRGWQPWNALQIFKNYREIRPEAVQKLEDGPASIAPCSRPPFPGITCDREDAAINRDADEAYVNRAAEKVPRSNFMGEDFEDMAEKLNIHLDNLLADTVGHADCSEFSIQELNDVMRIVNSARDSSLNSIYNLEMDPRRVIHKDHQALEARFMTEEEQLIEAPELEHMVRDGKCHEVVMWFIHHLSLESQREVAELVAMPYLPRVRHPVLASHDTDSHKAIDAQYQDEISCADCHLQSAV